MHSIKKTLLPLTFCFLAFSISSCSDVNDDLTPVNSANQANNNAPSSSTQKITTSVLVGDWEMISLDYAGTTSEVVAGQTLTTSFSGVGRDFTYQITFTDNPKTYAATGGYTVDLTTTFSGQTFTQPTAIPDASSSGTWNLVGNTLTITDASTNETNTTEILTGGQNNFSYDFAGLFGKSVGGANVSFTSGQVSYRRL
ncbi:MAG: lipocalin family protein [Vicingaceae bacterium]